MSRYLSDDVVTTYLSSGDLVFLIVAEDEDFNSSRIAVFDRASSMALTPPADFCTLERAQEIAEAASTNALLNSPVERVKFMYSWMLPENLVLDEVVQANSTRRLTYFLQDILYHVVTELTGQKINRLDIE